MAAFGTSYKSVLQNDIRHMYSYKSKEPGSRNTRQYHERMRPVTPLKRRFPPRFYDFFPGFNIGIPKAPAFREVDSEVMDIILERIRKPITCQSKSGRERCRKKIEPEEEEGRRVNAEEMDAITRRLQRATKCSQSRRYHRAGAGVRLPPIKSQNFIHGQGWVYENNSLSSETKRTSPVPLHVDYGVEESTVDVHIMWGQY